MLDSIAVPRRAYDFEDYIDILRRNFRWIIAPAFIGFVVSVVIAYMEPDQFISTATIHVTPQQISEDLIKNVTSQDVADRINAMALVIYSRSNLESLVNRYGLYKKELKSEPMEDVIEHMKGSIVFQGSGGTSAGQRFLPTLVVGFKYTDKYTAQKVCQDIIGTLTNLSSQEGVESQQQAHQFLTDEAQQAKRELEDAESKLADFRARNAGHLPEEEANNMAAMNAMNGRLSSLTESANRNVEQRMMQEQEMRILKDRMASLRNSSQQAAARNEKVAQLDTQISQLQDGIESMKQRYTDDFPDLQDAKSRLEYLKKQREQAAKEKPVMVDATPVDSIQVPIMMPWYCFGASLPIMA